MFNHFYFCLLFLLFTTKTTFSQTPTITNFTPVSGSVGSIVNIFGTNFNVNNTKVFLGGIKCQITYITSSQISLQIPSGAANDYITVISDNLSAKSIVKYSVYYPNATGNINSNTFPAVESFPCRQSSVALIGDINLDGLNDVVTLGLSDSSVIINKNNGGQAPLSFTSKAFTTGKWPSNASIYDMNCDGKLDIVTLDQADNNFSILSNTSTSSSISFNAKTSFSTGFQGREMTVDDFDLDGKPDVIVIAYNSSSNSKLIYYRNTSASATQYSFLSTITTFLSAPFKIGSADFNNDRKPELIMVIGTTTKIYPNTSSNGSITFGQEINLGNCNNFDVTDLNGDGKLDLCLVNEVGNVSKIYPYLNQSNNGTISLNLASNFPINTIDLSRAIKFADLNGDNKTDLVVYSGDAYATLFQNTSVGTNLSFQCMDTLLINPGGSNNAAVHQLSIGDMDLDLRPDFIISSNAPTNPKFNVTRNCNNLPSIMSFSPTSGTTGTTVKIKGTGFIVVNTVKFGGVDAASFTVHSNDSISAIVNNGATGSVLLKTNSGYSIRNGFTFNTVPQIQSFYPQQAGYGDTVIIQGNYLFGATSVKFGGIEALSFSVISPTQIQAVVKSSGSNGNITVTTLSGTTTKSGFTFILPNAKIVKPALICQGTNATISVEGLKCNNPFIVHYKFNNGNTVKDTSDQFGNLLIPINTTLNDSLFFSIIYIKDSNGNFQGLSILDTVLVKATPTSPIISSTSNSACTGDSILLTGNNGISLWNTGSSDLSIYAGNTGSYFVMTSNDCGVDTSNVIIISIFPVPTTPIITTSGSTIIYEGDSVLISTNNSSANNIWWSNNQSGNTIYAKQSGFYFAFLSQNGCLSDTSNTIYISTTNNPFYKDLVVYYDFNNNVLDKSGNQIHGINVGCNFGTDRFGNFNSAISTNGSNYIYSNADKLPTTERTISLWFKANTVSNSPCLLSYGGVTCGTSFIMPINNNDAAYNTFEIQGHCRNFRLTSSYNTPPINIWHHWAVTSDVTGTKMYIDGNLIASNNHFINNTYVQNKDFVVGNIISPGGVILNYSDPHLNGFIGLIDDVAIYNKALTINEIVNIFNSSNTAEELLFTSQTGGVQNKGAIFQLTKSSLSMFSSYSSNGPDSSYYPSDYLEQLNNGNFVSITLKGGENSNGSINYINDSTYLPIIAENFPANIKLSSADAKYIEPDSTFWIVGQSSQTNGYLIKYILSLDSLIIQDEFTDTLSGYYPIGSPCFISKEVFYLATDKGGNFGFGTILKYNTKLNTKSVILHFNGTHGKKSSGQLLHFENKIYGLTSSGSTNDKGLLFQINLSDDHIQTILSFDSTSLSTPLGGLTIIENNKLLGVTSNGGLYGNGGIFSMNLTTSSLNPIYQFGSNSTDPKSPIGKLYSGRNNILYGFTQEGCIGNKGCIYEFDPFTNTFMILLENQSANITPTTIPSLILSSQKANLTMRIFLEGYYVGLNEMHDELLTGGFVDTVNISFFNSSFPFNLVKNYKKILNKDGYIYFTPLVLPIGEYLIEVRHRNSIATWYKRKYIHLPNSNTLLDFTSN